MGKIALSFAVMTTLAIGVIGYAAVQPQPTHCARTASIHAAKAAKWTGNAQVLTAVDHQQHHHHHGAPGEVELMKNVIDPIPDCYPCDTPPVGCECGFWDRLFHCSFFMS